MFRRLGIILLTLGLASLARAAEAPAPEQTVTLIAVGDVMLSRAVAKRIKEKKDIHYPFLKIQEFLRSADLTFGNLECPITKGPVVKSGQMVFHADPGVEPALKDAGFAVMSLANNHLPDYGPKGVLNTLAALDAIGVAHAGAGKDEDEAEKPAILERHGLRFAFLAYNDQDVVPKRYGAAADHPGTNIMDEEKVTRDVQAAKKLADFVIVSMHSGWEYRKANPHQMAFARAAIDAGAELVIGHHPHVVQRAEWYKGKLILYSLGNFVFDQRQFPAVRQGMTVRITFTKAGVQAVQFTPVWIENAAQPRIVTEARLRKKILAKLGLPLGEDGTLPVPQTPVTAEKR